MNDNKTRGKHNRLVGERIGRADQNGPLQRRHRRRRAPRARRIHFLPRGEVLGPLALRAATAAKEPRSRPSVRVTAVIVTRFRIIIIIIIAIVGSPAVGRPGSGNRCGPIYRDPGPRFAPLPHRTLVRRYDRVSSTESSLQKTFFFNNNKKYINFLSNNFYEFSIFEPQPRNHAFRVFRRTGRDAVLFARRRRRRRLRRTKPGQPAAAARRVVRARRPLRRAVARQRLGRRRTDRRRVRPRPGAGLLRGRQSGRRVRAGRPPGRHRGPVLRHGDRRPERRGLVLATRLPVAAHRAGSPRPVVLRPDRPRRQGHRHGLQLGAPVPPVQDAAVQDAADQSRRAVPSPRRRPRKTEEENPADPQPVGRENRGRAAVRPGHHRVLRAQGAGARQTGADHRQRDGLPEVRRLVRRFRQVRRELQLGRPVVPAGRARRQRRILQAQHGTERPADGLQRTGAIVRPERRVIPPPPLHIDHLLFLLSFNL